MNAPVRTVLDDLIRDADMRSAYKKMQVIAQEAGLWVEANRLGSLIAMMERDIRRLEGEQT